MAESSLQRLLQISSSLSNASLRQEQRDLVNQLAREFNITLEPLENGDHNGESTKKSPRDEINSNGVSSAREKFKKQEKESSQEQKATSNNTLKRETRKSVVKPVAAANGTGNSDCDISSPAIKEAYVNHFYDTRK